MSQRSELIISELSEDKLKDLNRRLGLWVSGAPTSQYFFVSDIEQKQAHLVLIHLVNTGVISAPKAQTLVKFSQRQYAPPFTSCLKLATPTRYREYEGDEQGVRDEMDGLLNADVTPWMCKSLGISGANFKSTAKLCHEPEPWVYCTSISPQSEPELKKLQRGFSSRLEGDIEYDTITEIRDPNVFAIRLGVDFAINLNKSKHIVEDAISEMVYAKINVTTNFGKNSRPIDKMIHVYHGPVIYEDKTDVLYDSKYFSNTPNWPKYCFRKRTSFSDHMEYRFALSSLGKPREDVFFLEVSDELRCLTTLKS